MSLIKITDSDGPMLHCISHNISDQRSLTMVSKCYINSIFRIFIPRWKIGNNSRFQVPDSFHSSVTSFPVINLGKAHHLKTSRFSHSFSMPGKP